MINDTIFKAQEHRAIIFALKKESNYYPSVLIRYYERFERPEPTKQRERPNRIINRLASMLTWKNKVEEPIKEQEIVCYASTLVRIERNGEWYIVHCVESIFLSKFYTEAHLLLKLIESVHKIQLLYNVTAGQNMSPMPHDLDALQQPEIERIAYTNYIGMGINKFDELLKHGLTLAEIMERERLLELQKDDKRWMSQEEFDRLKELSKKLSFISDTTTNKKATQ